MERWSGRVAVVTGASSTVGAAIVKELVKKGLTVVGIGRRVELVQDQANSLKLEKGKLFPLKCDVSKELQVVEAFKWIKAHFETVDILINNAGVAFYCPLTDGSTEKWRTIFDLNVLGLSVCTREALKVMKKRGVNDGHIVHINSILGQRQPGELVAMYSASKHAVTVLTEGLRRELFSQRSRIRVSSVSPGMVKSEVSSRDILERQTCLTPEDIADAVMYILGTPSHVQVHEMTLLPVGSP